MKYKLFISDFDGTLGVAPSHVEEETIKAIKEYQAKGGIFVICTGRSYLSIKKVCNQYGIKGIVISFQGALANDLEKGEVLFDGGMDKEDTAMITKDLLDMGIETGVYLDDLYYYDHFGPQIEEYERLVMVKGVLVDDLCAEIRRTDKKIKKVLSRGEPEVLDKAQAILEEKYKGKLIINRSARRLVEAISPEWSKRQAVIRIAEYYNIPLSEVIAVGDSTNDIGLLDGEWHGVAVGDAMEELKKYAKEITVPFEEQPVKFLLEKYCL